jgi:hypothetical protein
MLNNEEDVKLKLVSQYLESLGLAPDELAFERSFFLRMGRYTYRVDTKEQVDTAQPRLDILVTRNGANLFVIEVKSNKVELTQNDIDQAVSYARLVHPIAPYSVVTNGQDWLLIDTITKAEVPNGTFPMYSDGPYTVALPDEAYYEALRMFLGYSKDNLISFCKWQIGEYMRPLRGSRDVPNRKYIPDLYVPRAQLDASYQQFTESQSHCFAAIAESGAGKTCWLCHSALSRVEEGHPVLFYRTSDVEDGVFQAIAKDLDWTFSEQHNDVQAIRKISDLFEAEDLYVFVDGLDEIGSSQAIRITRDLLRRADGRNMKLVSTCKTTEWPSMLEVDGIPTVLADHVFKVGNQPGVRLGELSQPEFFNMIERYKQFYGVGGRFEADALEEAKRSPFLLRIMFEVAANSQSRDISLSVRSIYDAYYDELRRRFPASDRDLTDAILASVALVMYESNSDVAEMDAVRHKLGHPPTWSIPARFFELSILERHEHEHAVGISFYFRKLRDYMIAYRVQQWHRLTPTELSARLAGEHLTAVRLEALTLYYTLASEEHKRVIDEPLYSNALKYVDTYQELIDTHFPSFRRSFRPNTSGPIGFASFISLSRRNLFLYGFRPVEANNSRILLFPRERLLPDEQDNRSYLAGAIVTHSVGSADGFRSLNVLDEVVWSEIQPALDEITKNGMLDESRNEYLLKERVLAAAVSSYAEYFGFDTTGAPAKYPWLLHTDSSDLARSYLPLSLGRLRQAVLHSRAYKVLYNQEIDRKIQVGEVEVRREGRYSSHSGTLERDEQIRLDAEAWELARAGVRVPTSTIYRYWDDLEETLLEDVSNLQKMGITEIGRSPLTAWYDEHRPQSGTAVSWQIEQIRETLPLIQVLFQLFLAEYAALVERNFPTMYKSFDFFAKMPLTLFVVVVDDQERLKEWLPYGPSLTIYECTGPEVEENVIVSCLRSEIELNKRDGGEESLIYNGTKYEFSSWSDMGVDLITSPVHDYTRFELRKEMCLLRSLVYQQVRDDLSKVFVQLAASLGAPRPKARHLFRAILRT